MRRTLISGHISETLSEKGIFEKFQKAEEYLKNINLIPVNPVQSNPFKVILWPQRLSLLISCDAIFMLSDWKQDPQAVTERFYSELTGKQIIYESSVVKSDLMILRITEAIREVTGWTPADYRINEKSIDGRGLHRGYLGRLLFSHYAVKMGFSLDEICIYFERSIRTVSQWPGKFDSEYNFNTRFRAFSEKLDFVLLK